MATKVRIEIAPIYFDLLRELVDDALRTTEVTEQEIRAHSEDMDFDDFETVLGKNLRRQDMIASLRSILSHS